MRKIGGSGSGSGSSMGRGCLIPVFISTLHLTYILYQWVTKVYCQNKCCRGRTRFQTSDWARAWLHEWMSVGIEVSERQCHWVWECINDGRGNAWMIIRVNDNDWVGECKWQWIWFNESSYTLARWRGYSDRFVWLSRILTMITSLKMVGEIPRYIATFHGLPSLPSAAYMRRWIGPSLVQMMTCRLFGAKPLSKLVLGYFQLDHWELILEKYSNTKL